MRANANVNFSKQEKDVQEKSTMPNLNNETKSFDDDVNRSIKETSSSNDDVNRKETSHVEGSKI